MVVNSHYINRKKVKKRKKEKLQSLLLSPNMSINKYVSPPPPTDPIIPQNALVLPLRMHTVGTRTTGDSSTVLALSILADQLTFPVLKCFCICTSVTDP
jgi:hypothetical protein